MRHGKFASMRQASGAAFAPIPNGRPRRPPANTHELNAAIVMVMTSRKSTPGKGDRWVGDAEMDYPFNWEAINSILQWVFWALYMKYENIGSLQGPCSRFTCW